MAVLGALVGVVASSACPVDDIPACPGQCFEHTLEAEVPRWCQNDGAQSFAIAFTGHDPDGYRGRYCFNS